MLRAANSHGVFPSPAVSDYCAVVFFSSDDLIAPTPSPSAFLNPRELTLWEKPLGIQG